MESAPVEVRDGEGFPLDGQSSLSTDNGWLLEKGPVSQTVAFGQAQIEVRPSSFVTVNLEPRDHPEPPALARYSEMCQYFDLEAMDIQVESLGGRCTFRIRGKITFEHCAELQSRFDAAVGGDTREVIIDFGEVPFIDSSGIGEILRLYKHMRERSGEIALVNPNNKLRTLFAMYRFDKFMKIRDETEAPASMPPR